MSIDSGSSSGLAGAWRRSADRVGLCAIAPLASMVLVLAPVGAAALPWYAYFEGHPFRIRYGVPLVVACAALVGAGIGLLPRVLRTGAAIVAVAASIWQVSPLDRTAPVIVESQRDAQNMGAAARSPLICARTTMGARS